MHANGKANPRNSLRAHYGGLNLRYRRGNIHSEMAFGFEGLDIVGGSTASLHSSRDLSKALSVWKRHSTAYSGCWNIKSGKLRVVIDNG